MNRAQLERVVHDGIVTEVSATDQVRATVLHPMAAANRPYPPLRIAGAPQHFAQGGAGLADPDVRAAAVFGSLNRRDTKPGPPVRRRWAMRSAWKIFGR
ncbi:hypothetical protein [Paractinoplanes abujensis]|uniref:Uncharacterized protein n=1 Tax=Paractinoplanes abujensis TaxID=882441 RepID=A0A7W7CLD4_9ACTN|nr:hypothetical protein [Actinoplanes abujensis]MBB4690602.1 hypothetical protein [Actinoplanes abujensis]